MTQTIYHNKPDAIENLVHSPRRSVVSAIKRPSSEGTGPFTFVLSGKFIEYRFRRSDSYANFDLSPRYISVNIVNWPSVVGIVPLIKLLFSLRCIIDKSEIGAARRPEFDMRAYQDPGCQVWWPDRAHLE